MLYAIRERKGAAAWLGVSESTLYRWRHGATPTGPKIQAARMKAARIRMRRTRKPLPDLETATISWLFDGRYRTTELWRLHLDTKALRKAQDRLIDGDEAGAGAAFVAGIGDHWYQSHFAAYEVNAFVEDWAEDHEGELPDQDIIDEYLADNDYDQFFDYYDPEIVAEENEKYTFAVGGFD